jgi:hypothetical protein
MRERCCRPAAHRGSRTEAFCALPNEGIVNETRGILRRRWGGTVRQRTDAVPPEDHLAYLRPATIRHAPCCLSTHPAVVEHAAFDAVESQNTMLRRTKDLQDLAIGEVKALRFINEPWATRHLVVAAASWLSSRKALISSNAAAKPDWAKRTATVRLTPDALAHVPWHDPCLPLARGMQMAGHRHCMNRGYWPDMAHEPESVLPIHADG